MERPDPGFFLTLGFFSKGANIHSKNSLGWPPLFIAIQGGHNDVVKYFIDSGFDINKDSGGNTPLLLAVANNQEETVRLLINNGVNVNLRAPDGSTALIMAELINNKKIEEILLSSGATRDENWGDNKKQ